MLSPRNKIFCILLLCAALPSYARKVKIKHSTLPLDTANVDTGRSCFTDTLHTCRVKLYGYDKTREATHESIFATNHDTMPLTRLTIMIDYRTTDGRQLHRRKVDINCSIPAGETRRLDFPTWDRQHTFYYHRSPAPKRAQATPYTVACTVIAIVLDTKGL